MNISPSQALLMLIDHFKSNKDILPYSDEKFKRFLVLYLDGTRNPMEVNELKGYFSEYKHDILKGYDVSYTKKIIKDP